MYLATQPRKGDLEEFFAHESQNYFPPSLAVNVEKMYHSRKPDVVVVVVVVENIYKAPLVKKTSEVLWLLLH